jgi:opacity protein-like surface antigen
MNTTSRCATLLVLGLHACSSTSTPRDDSGFYARANGGYGTTLDGAFDPEGGEADGEYAAGFIAGGALGYEIDRSWSIEADWTYRRGEIDSIGPAGAVATGGDYASVAATANLIYSFERRGDWRPYVGIGYGFVQEIDADLQPAGDEVSDRGAPAYQVFAGTGWRASEALELTVEGRYLGTSGVELEGGGLSFDADYENLGVLFGLRWLP